MFIRKIIVQIDKNGTFESSHHLKLSKSLCKKWEIGNGDQVQFQFGKHIEMVTIIETLSFRTPTIEISLPLAEKMSIPFEIMPIHCLYNQERNTLKLGPIIACMTNQMYHDETKFGSLTIFFEELARFAKRHHILFYIKPLLKNNESIYGYSFQEEHWKKQLFPDPDAVYNRIGSRSFEASMAYKDFITTLEENQIHYFNHCFLDKWDIHESLSSFPEMAPYLPRTTLFSDYEPFAEMLTIYPFIFVKPINGSQGRQILKIENNEHKYDVFYSSISQENSTTFHSSYLLFKRLKERLTKKTFIVQQGIDLINYEERALDFRVLCIKNEEGLWRVVSSVARISSKEKMVSNLAQGGEQKRPLEILTTLFDEKLAKQYVRLMGELALEVAHLISESYDGLFGELGIDIGLDKEGKLWIIEVNSKPSKIDQDEPNDQIRPSTKAILAYLAFLAGYPLQRSEKRKER